MQAELQPGGRETSPPDWSRFVDDIPCPRCGYNLRELARSLCPECGLAFDWPAVLNQAATRLKPLFEFQWPRRPLRSFFHSTWGLLRPWRFWRQLAITDKPRITSLALQLLTTLVLCVVVQLPVALSWHLLTYWQFRRGRSRLFRYPWPDYVSEWTGEAGQPLAVLAAVGLITTLILALFWQTRGRYRIRADAQLRVGIYAMLTLIVSWTVVSTFVDIMGIISSAVGSWPIWRAAHHIGIGYIPSVIAFPSFFLCLGSGLRTHLRINGGWRLASLTVATTFAVVVFIVVQSALTMNTFSQWSNPIVRCYLRVLPPFWGY